LSAKIDYTAGNAYRLFEIARPLYFNLTVFPYYNPTSITVTAMTSYSASGNWFLEITTSTSHGLAAGDSVFFDFDAGYSGDTYLPHTLPNGSSGYTYVVAVSPAPTTTKFYIDVDGTFPAPGVSVTRTEGPRGTDNEVYKVYEAALDLSAIKLRYPNGQTTDFYDVLSPLTKADWDAGTNKYLISYANDYMNQALNPNIKISPIPKTGSLVIDGASIAAAYQAADPTSFATGEDIYVDLPGWMLKHDGNVTVSGTKLANTGYIVDNVHLSTAPNFFYGSELATNRWFATTEDVISYDPAQASIEGTKTWMSIDLTTQAATLDYFNQIGFRNNTFTKPMVARPSAGTQDDTPIYQTFPDSEYETTTLSGGQYQYSDTVGYINLSSTLKLLTGGKSSGFELSSGYRSFLDDGSFIGRKAAVISATHKGYGDGISNDNITTIRIGSDRLVWTEDTDNLSSSASERIVIDRNEVPFGDGNPTLTSYIAVIVNNTISTNNTVTSTDTGTGFHANGGDIRSTAGNIYTTAGDIYTTVGDVYTSNGRVTANTARLTSTASYSLSSTTHPFQVGPTNDANLRIDDNGIQTVNNGSAATLNINTFGGNLTIGNSASVVSSLGSISSTGDLTVGTAAVNSAITRAYLAGGGTTGATFSNAGALVRTVSSARYKQDIEDAEYSYTDVLSLSPKTFRLKEEVESNPNARVYAGLIAEEVDQIEGLKVFVNYLTQEDGSVVPDGIAYGEMVSALVSALKHQDTLITSLKNRLDALEGN
jgi:hypothetical protein